MFATCSLIFPFPRRTACGWQRATGALGGGGGERRGGITASVDPSVIWPRTAPHLTLGCPCSSSTPPISCYTVHPWSLYSTSLCLECSFSGYLPGPLLSFRFLLGSQSHTTHPVPCPASFPWLHSQSELSGAVLISPQ